MGTALPWVSSRPSMRAAHLVRLSVKNSLAGLRGASSRHDDAESRTDLHHMLKSCPGCDAAASTKQTLVNIAHHWATLDRLPDRNRLIPDGTNAAASSRGPRLSTVALNKRVQHAEFIGGRLMRSRVDAPVPDQRWGTCRAARRRPRGTAHNLHSHEGTNDARGAHVARESSQ